MIESVERLKKFVVSYSTCEATICATPTASLTISDLKEALSLIPPYAPGQEIEVECGIDKLTGKFVGLDADGEAVIEQVKNKKGEIISGNGGDFDYDYFCAFNVHRPIPATVDLKGFPVDAVKLAEEMMDGAEAPYYSENCKKLIRAIVSSAREVKGE